ERGDHIARQRVYEFLRDELISGALTAYQRDTEMREWVAVNPRNWLEPLLDPGMDLFVDPPRFFYRKDLAAWLKKVTGNIKKRGRPPIESETAERAIKALGKALHNEMKPKQKRDRIIQWCFDHKEKVPSDETIDRVLGKLGK